VYGHGVASAGVSVGRGPDCKPEGGGNSSCSELDSLEENTDQLLALAGCGGFPVFREYSEVALTMRVSKLGFIKGKIVALGDESGIFQAFYL